MDVLCSVGLLPRDFGKCWISAIFLPLRAIDSTTHPQGFNYPQSGGCVHPTVGTTWHWVTYSCCSSTLGLPSSHSLSSTHCTIQKHNPGRKHFGKNSIVLHLKCLSQLHNNTHLCTKMTYVTDMPLSLYDRPPSGKSCPLPWQTWLLKNIISYQAREVRERQVLSESDGWASFKWPSGK